MTGSYRQQEKTTGLLVADGDKITITEVLDELRTLPFLTKKRVVVIRDADKLISARGEEDEQNEQTKCSRRLLKP